MDLSVELTRLVLRRGSRKVVGLPLHLNLLGSVKALPVSYLLGRFRKIYLEDDRFREVAEALCPECVARSAEGVTIVDRALIVEAYYNTIAQEVLALAPGIDSIAVPCFTGALGEAVARRAREAEPGLTVVAAKLGDGFCGWADVVYEGLSPPPLPRALRIGPASSATISAALRAQDERSLFSTVALLTDWRP